MMNDSTFGFRLIKFWRFEGQMWILKSKWCGKKYGLRWGKNSFTAEDWCIFQSQCQWEPIDRVSKYFKLNPGNVRRYSETCYTYQAMVICLMARYIIGLWGLSTGSNSQNLVYNIQPETPWETSNGADKALRTFEVCLFCHSLGDVRSLEHTLTPSVWFPRLYCELVLQTENFQLYSG